MPILTVSSKGHIILPKAIREALAVRAGDCVEVSVERGVVKVRRAESKADALVGALRGLAPRPLNWKRLRRDMARQVAADAAKEH